MTTTTVAALLAWGPPPAAADTVDGAGAAPTGTVTESAYSWRLELPLRGSFALDGRTYAFAGHIHASNCCSSRMGSSGTGSWQFNGSLYSPTGAVEGLVGSASGWSGSASYTRTEVVPGAEYALKLRLSGPATATLPGGRSLSFTVEFAVSGNLADANPLDPTCGSYPAGCEYDATYEQTAWPSGAAPTEGTGAMVSGSVREHSSSWHALVVLEGSFVLSGHTYGFLGQLEAGSDCCSSLASSGGGRWHFSGWLYDPTGVVDGFVGSTTSWSGSASYTRTELVPGTLYSLDMRLRGQATATVPGEEAVTFDIGFDLGGELADPNPLEGLCGSSPGCTYDGTYNQHDRPSLLAVSATGGATSSRASVGWGDSAAHGGLVCISATGDCYGASRGVGVCPFGRCE